MSNPAPIRDQLTNTLDDRRAHRLWNTLPVRASKRTRARRVSLAAAGLVVCVALVFALRGSSIAPGPLELANGDALTTFRADIDGGTFDLSDGSSIALVRGSELVPGTNDGERFETVLLRGEARFSVRPGGPRRWRIHTVLGVVEVVGTIFSVRIDGPAVEVSVERGHVRVRSEVLGIERDLIAGERLRLERPAAPAHADAPEIATPAAPSSDAQEAAAIEDAPLRPNVRRVEARDHPAVADDGWREAAQAGRYDEAYAIAAPQVDRIESEGSAQDLLALADTARLSGHPIEAVVPLETLIDRFPGSAEAGLGALTLARLEMGVLRRPERAARALDALRELPLPPALREEAAGRGMLARERVGRLEEARAEAVAYVAAYPEGRYAQDARRIADGH